MSIFADIIAHRELLANLIARNLKSRYKDSIFGFLWSILTPLFMAGISRPWNNYATMSFSFTKANPDARQFFPLALGPFLGSLNSIPSAGGLVSVYGKKSHPGSGNISSERGMEITR